MFGEVGDVCVWGVGNVCGRGKGCVYMWGMMGCVCGGCVCGGCVCGEDWRFARGDRDVCVVGWGMCEGGMEDVCVGKNGCIVDE